MSELASYRRLFPITRTRAYLATSGLAPLSMPVAAAISRQLQEHMEMGSGAMPNWYSERARARTKMANFVGAGEDEMAMVSATAVGLDVVATGLRWRDGDRVVLSDQEFPANWVPWVNLKRRGVRAVIVRSAGGAVPIERVIDAIDGRTRLVAISWVQFSTGYRTDLRSLTAAAHERGALVAVDAIQGLGALPFNVRQLGVDFFASSSHKWLCAPPFIGWLYVAREHIGSLEPTFVGANSIEPGSELDYQRPLRMDARRFEPSTSNFFGFEAAIDLLTEIGIGQIAAHIKRLTDRIAAGLVSAGFIPRAPRTAEQWSGIVSVDYSSRWSRDQLLERLERAGVVAAIHPDRLTVSAHFFNNDDDVDALLSAVSR
jgi:cysteine desulfurase/selenocysteine lyase